MLKKTRRRRHRRVRSNCGSELVTQTQLFGFLCNPYTQTIWCERKRHNLILNLKCLDMRWTWGRFQQMNVGLNSSILLSYTIVFLHQSSSLPQTQWIVHFLFFLLAKEYIHVYLCSNSIVQKDSSRLQTILNELFLTIQWYFPVLLAFKNEKYPQHSLEYIYSLFNLWESFECYGFHIFKLFSLASYLKLLIVFFVWKCQKIRPRSLVSM